MQASEFQSSRKFVQTAFGRIAYVERGSGPVALFVHALPLCGYQWRYALDELSSMRTCVAPDMMGLGYSEIPARCSLHSWTHARSRRLIWSATTRAAVSARSSSRFIPNAYDR
jgi:pimeloyl-ACP methyl ester carboxylesterase